MVLVSLGCWRGIEDDWTGLGGLEVLRVEKMYQ